MTHPSFFELDAWALGEVPSKELRAHVDECAECLAHIARITPDGESLPLWVRQLNAVDPSIGRVREKKRWLGAAVLAVAAGVILVVALSRPSAPSGEQTRLTGSNKPALLVPARPSSVEGVVPPSPESLVDSHVPWKRQGQPERAGLGQLEGRSEREYLAAKGAPHVKIVVKRRDTLFVWQDQQAIQPGDRFMLHLAPSGYREVSVLGSMGGKLRTLYQGKVPEGGELPKAWEVDEEAGAERLIVVLSDVVLSNDELERALAGKVLGQRLWVQEVVLPKLVQP